ncbi:polysaccharide deacetylase family protein [Actinophytocola oryzae]|nr:polysaccharide deacetylase family protein [Actinophytocola oryzae]
MTRLLVPLLVAAVGATPARADRSTPPTSAIVDSTAQGGRTVSFTFDDGPDPQNTPRLLKLLRQQQIRAVFCLTGDNVLASPGLVRWIVAEGHLLCNHSTHHDDLSTWTPEAIRADLLETNAAIRAAVPWARIPYFRAPFGAWGRTPAVAASLGMQPLGWRLAISDWEPPGTEVLVDRLMNGITEGAVVLMHDGGGDRTQTIEAVGEVTPRLRADGWRLTVPARRG